MTAYVGPIQGIAHGIYDGPHATPPEADSGPVFLGIKNLTPEGRLDLSEIRHISEEHYPKWIRRVAPRAHDIVFSYEATLHRYAIIPEGFRGCLGRRLALIRPNTDRVVPRFLHYYLLSTAWRTVVERKTINGATVDRIPIASFPDFEIRIPGLSAQRRVVSTLSAYDDLIENNRRRIRLLEQSARLLYEEWFIRFRFPGHENVRITNGVPDGWKYRTVEDKSNLTRGRSYRSTELVESGGKPFVNLKCIARHGGFRLDGLKKFAGEHKDDQSVSAGDIVVALTDMTRERHVVAHAARVPEAMGSDAVFSMDTVKITPADTIDRQWFYYFLRYSGFSAAVRERATGTNVLHLKPKDIAEHGFHCPPMPLQEHFGEITSHVLSQQDNLEIQNRELAQARDVLLPRLMNGEIAA